ncbi:hypothetical protein I4F81_002293 [Pyropia yezoensis]|uniref:Uncharacterized protein n=1 Tax=Pyropia yezoensis TaxID=2788 RepID=A0ACC3BNY0_PYRYE|nr:hypothetical protein I4F81_002293 [Neopyropia yezoensis]
MDASIADEGAAGSCLRDGVDADSPQPSASAGDTAPWATAATTTERAEATDAPSTASAAAAATAAAATAAPAAVDVPPRALAAGVTAWASPLSLVRMVTASSAAAATAVTAAATAGVALWWGPAPPSLPPVAPPAAAGGTADLTEVTISEGPAGLEVRTLPPVGARPPVVAAGAAALPTPSPLTETIRSSKVAAAAVATVATTVAASAAADRPSPPHPSSPASSWTERPLPGWGPAAQPVTRCPSPPAFLPSPAAVRGSSSCGICFQPTPAAAMTPAATCGHRYCRGCLATHWVIQVRERCSRRPRCPHPGCESVTSNEHILAAGGPGAAATVRRLRYLRSLAPAAGDPTARWCASEACRERLPPPPPPTVGCRGGGGSGGGGGAGGGGITGSGGGGGAMVACRICGTLTCHACGGSHAAGPCAVVGANQRGATPSRRHVSWQESPALDCAHCGVRMKMVRGCLPIKCTACRRPFQYAPAGGGADGHGSWWGIRGRRVPLPAVTARPLESAATAAEVETAAEAAAAAGRGAVPFDGQPATTPEDDALYTAWAARHAGSCPTCNVHIERRGGCNTVTCTICGTTFPWICFDELDAVTPRPLVAAPCQRQHSEVDMNGPSTVFAVVYLVLFCYGAYAIVKDVADSELPTGARVAIPVSIFIVLSLCSVPREPPVDGAQCQREHSDDIQGFRDWAFLFVATVVVLYGAYAVVKDVLGSDLPTGAQIAVLVSIPLGIVGLCTAVHVLRTETPRRAQPRGCATR